MSGLANYWNLPPTAKDRIVSEIPQAKTRCKIKMCRCKHADAHECAIERRLPAGYGMCDCECHSH